MNESNSKDIAYYFKILEIEPNSTLKEVNKARREMVLIWHPDRFQNNESLKLKAEKKLQEINNAYDIITKHYQRSEYLRHQEEKRSQDVKNGQRHEEEQKQKAKSEKKQKTEFHHKHAQSTGHKKTSKEKPVLPISIKILFFAKAIGAFAIAIFLLYVLITIFSVRNNSGNYYAPASSQRLKPDANASKGYLNDSPSRDLVSVKYDVSNEGGSIHAIVGQRRYRIISSADSTYSEYYRITEQRDFDGNGTLDALVERDIGYGGNCCGSSYFFISNVQNAQFQITEEFGYTWTEPIIEEWGGTWSVIVVSTNEGSNTNPAVEITSRYILDNDFAVEVERS